MVLIYIFAFIVFLLSLIAWSNVHLNIKYENELCVNIRFWFLSFNLIPRSKRANGNKKKQNKATKKKDNKKSSGILLKTLKKKGISNSIEIVKGIASLLLTTLKRVLSKTVIEYIDFNCLIVGEDAADTAIKYGYAYSMIYPILSIMKLSSVCKKQNINIVADYVGEKTNICGQLKIHIRVSVLIWALYFVLVNGMKYVKKMNI